MRGATFLALVTVMPAAHAAEPAAPRFEGAVGLIAQYAPSYGGADDYRLRFSPAGFIRYGRITISGAGGFTTRREDDVERGLAAELIDGDDLRLRLSGRWTNGRRESASSRLAGLGDIEGTLLARLHLQWTPGGPWRYGLAVSVDALGHGSGWVAEVSVARDWAIGPQTKLQFGAALNGGSDTYMQSWYGITPEQASRTGYPAYEPGNGLRDVALGLTLRHEISKDWGSFVSGTLTEHVGVARHSPLVIEPTGASLRGGLVYRF